MTLSRIASTLAAVTLGGVVVASTYGAQAADTPAAPRHTRAHHAAFARADHFRAPVTHKYGANGMRMGFHCETSDMS